MLFCVKYNFDFRVPMCFKIENSSGYEKTGSYRNLEAFSCLWLSNTG